MVQQDQIEHDQRVSAKEAELLRMVRGVKYGEVRVIIKNGQIDYFQRTETVKP
jgi:hypothetical protein